MSQSMGPIATIKLRLVKFLGLVSIEHMHARLIHLFLGLLPWALASTSGERWIFEEEPNRPNRPGKFVPAKDPVAVGTLEVPYVPRSFLACQAQLDTVPTAVLEKILEHAIGEERIPGHSNLGSILQTSRALLTRVRIILTTRPLQWFFGAKEPIPSAILADMFITMILKQSAKSSVIMDDRLKHAVYAIFTGYGSGFRTKVLYKSFGNPAVNDVVMDYYADLTIRYQPDRTEVVLASLALDEALGKRELERLELSRKIDGLKRLYIKFCPLCQSTEDLKKTIGGIENTSFRLVFMAEAFMYFFYAPDVEMACTIMDQSIVYELQEAFLLQLGPFVDKLVASKTQMNEMLYSKYFGTEQARVCSYEDNPRPPPQDSDRRRDS